MDLTLARWCAQATRWLCTQAKARCLPLSGHKTPSKFRRFLIQDKSDRGMQDELQRWGHRGRESLWAEARPTERALMPSDFYQNPPHTWQPIYFNHMHPSLPSKLVLPIWLWKAPPRPWLQQPQLTISTFVLSCFFVAKIAAPREFDFLSLLLKSRAATFAHSESFFCPTALVADNIKLSEKRRCWESLRTQEAY